MPRSKFLDQREVLPDVRYRDKLVGKFVNTLMSGGKKSTAERICYGAFDAIQEKTGNDPLKVFKAAIDNVKPIVEVRDRNNQPVAGVIVTFSIEGGKAATFGGSSTLTIATNAAGRAAVVWQ